jgi:hypothetical protein
MGLLDKDIESFDRCPEALKDNKINVRNHMKAIKDYGLGPADPRQPNTAYWQDKGYKWGITEGDARGRLCCNCEHFIATSQIVKWINNGPVVKSKASGLPVTPKWTDIESRPVAFCSLLDITCSPIRTCDEQEMGGPIDDQRLGK